MKNISVHTQGVKGRNSQTKNVGYASVALRHEQDRITIDDFEGAGESYKQRELQLIEIYQNGVILFHGDKYELFEILRANNKK